jgi:hypothetical protein
VRCYRLIGRIFANCHADTFATDYLDDWSETVKIVPLIPASKASISIASVTFTPQRRTSLSTHLHMAWKLRNADLHGVDTADQKAKRKAKRKAKLKPAIVALYKTADTLDCLNKQLFNLHLPTRLDKQKSHEEMAWINLATTTVRQAKAEAAGHIPRTRRDIREFSIRPAAQNAVPRPLAVQITEQQPIPRLRGGEPSLPGYYFSLASAFADVSICIVFNTYLLIVTICSQWVDFSWELGQEERDEAKWISFITR